MRILLTGLLAVFAMSFAHGEEVPTVPPKPVERPERVAVDRLRNAISKKDDDAAKQLLDQILRDFPGKAEADEAVVQYTIVLDRKGELAKTEAMLLALRASGRENFWVTMALFSLVDDAQKRGDERAFVGYLESALKPRATTGGGVIAVNDHERQTALRILADHYRRKGDWMKGLAYYTRWNPQSRCGNCDMSLRAERHQGIELCLLGTGDYEIVLDDRLESLRGTYAPTGFSAWTLWRFYVDAGQADDLRKMVDDYEAANKEEWEKENKRLGRFARSYAPSYDLRGLLRIQAAVEKNDLKGLAAICQEPLRPASDPAEARLSQEHVGFDMVRCAAADALAAFNGAATEPIKDALSKNPKTKGWLIYALGRSKDPATVEVLKDLLEKLPDHENQYYTALSLSVALILKGEEGKKVLSAIPETQVHKAGTARSVLNSKFEPFFPTPYWPKPKAGSLPKTLKEAR